MSQTEQWTEEKLIEEVSRLIDKPPMRDKGIKMGEFTVKVPCVDWEAQKRQIHELYKSATYLPGNKELPFWCKGCEGRCEWVNAGFKSTEEWKK